MKNIHVIPTSQPSRLYLNTQEYIFEEEYSLSTDECQNKNIYITSDEEIREGDYVCASGGFRFVKTLNNDKFRTFKDDGIVSKQNPSCSCHLSNYRKIILTTDQDLINDGVQAIDDEFLEWYVKNPSCEEIGVIPYLKDIINPLTNEKFPTVQHRHFDETKMICKYHYKIIIPKEEPKKVLTEEDIFNQKDIDAVTDYINKEQQKQHLIDMMKSDEELGLYEEPKMNKIQQEIFEMEQELGVPSNLRYHNSKPNQQKKFYTEEEFRKALIDINLVNPSHLQMTSNGHGEFPDGYKLTQKGVDYIIEQFKRK